MYFLKVVYQCRAITDTVDITTDEVDIHSGLQQ